MAVWGGGVGVLDGIGVAGGGAMVVSVTVDVGTTCGVGAGAQETRIINRSAKNCFIGSSCQDPGKTSGVLTF